MPPETVEQFITVMAAFVSGIGSVLTGYLALRYERNRSREECENRIKALKEGMEMRERAYEGKPMLKEVKDE